MATKMLVMLAAALLLASAGARSLRLPEARFASLEGFAAEDSDGADVARVPRHLMDFAEFDRPLTPDDQQPIPHRRFARGATEPSDGADNPDLVAEIVETAPVAEGPLLPEYAVPQPSAVVELVEAPEELAGVKLTADDAQLEDDQEATLCEEGLHPEDEAEVEPCAGRPARHLDSDGSSEEAGEVAASAAAALNVEDVSKEDSSEEVKSVASADTKLEASKSVKTEVGEASEGVKTLISDEGAKAEVSEAKAGVKVQSSEDAAVVAAVPAQVDKEA